MKITFDAAKSKKNISERGFGFECVADFDFATASIQQDVRRQYPEPRFVALGFLNNRLHVLCFTPTHKGIRVISFRKANDREVKSYEQTTTAN